MTSRRRRRPSARRRPARDPKRRLLVVCEGLVTEREYLRGLERWARNAAVEIIIPGQQGDPKTLVEIAKREKRKAENLAKKEEDDFLSFDEVWCVCDVDEHDRLPDARQMARDNDIRMVVSNPCFELWLLLHFREQPGPRHRHDLQSLLKTFMAGYDKHLNFAELADGVMVAIDRARRLVDEAVEEGAPGRNPTTEVYHLVDSVLDGRTSC